MGPSFDPTAVITAAQNLATAAGTLRDSVGDEHGAEGKLTLAQQAVAGAQADVDAAKATVDANVAATLAAEQALINLITPPTPAGDPANPPQGDGTAAAATAA